MRFLHSKQVFPDAGRRLARYLGTGSLWGLVGLMALLPTVRAGANMEIPERPGTQWTAQYNGQVVPWSANPPAITYSNGATGSMTPQGYYADQHQTVSIDGSDWCKIDTLTRNGLGPLQQGVYFQIPTAGGNLNLRSSVGYTVEWRVRALDVTAGSVSAMALTGGDAGPGGFWVAYITKHDGKFWAALNYIGIYGPGEGGEVAIDPDTANPAFHVLRVTAWNGAARLHVDGVYTCMAAFRPDVSGAPLTFGDQTAAEDARFQTDYLRVYDGAAVAPGSLDPFFPQTFANGTAGANIGTLGWTIGGSAILVTETTIDTGHCAALTGTGWGTAARYLPQAFPVHLGDTVELTAVVKVPAKTGSAGGKAAIQIQQADNYYWQLCLDTVNNQFAWYEGPNDSTSLHSGMVPLPAALIGSTQTVDLMIQARKDETPRFFYRLHSAAVPNPWSLIAPAYKSSTNDAFHAVDNIGGVKALLYGGDTAHQPLLDTVKLANNADQRIKLIDKEVHFKSEPHVQRGDPGTIRDFPAPPSSRVCGSYPIDPATGQTSYTLFNPQTGLNEHIGFMGSRGFVLMDTSVSPYRLMEVVYVSRYASEVAEQMDIKLWYATKVSNGVSWDLYTTDFQQIIAQGSDRWGAFGAAHPVREVFAPTVNGSTILDNGEYYIGGFTRIIRASNGDILVPYHHTVWDAASSKPYNPVPDHYAPGSRATGYLNSGMLIGTWKSNNPASPDYGKITWQVSTDITLEAPTLPRDQDPRENVSTRGLCEPTVVELCDADGVVRPGEFLCFLRGSNEWHWNYPGRLWMSRSHDYGRTWTTPVKVTYTDGKDFVCPSSISVLVRSSKNNRLYWVGNVLDYTDGSSPQLPLGNGPRYPLVMVEVNENDATIGLKSETLTVLADHQGVGANGACDSPRQNPNNYRTDDLWTSFHYMQLSNHNVIEDPWDPANPTTGRFYIYLYRADYYWPGSTGTNQTWPSYNGTDNCSWGPLNWWVADVPSNPGLAVAQKVQGTVILDNYAGNRRMVGVQVAFLRSGTALTTAWTLLDSQGAFSIPDMAPGTYDVAVKACSWRQTVMTGVTVGVGTTDLGTIRLTGGDDDGDNGIDGQDLSIVLKNMDMKGQ